MGTHRPHTRSTLLAALAVLLLVAGGCRVAPPPGTSHSPSGSLDRITVEIGPQPGYYQESYSVIVEGWASDWDTPAPIHVAFFVIEPMLFGVTHSEWAVLAWALVDVGGVAGVEPIYTLRADVPRPDVDAAFHRGARFGYRQYLSFRAAYLVDDPTICVAALNVGPGENTLLGCRKADVFP